MSVIVRTPDNRIKVFCKGADSIILPLLINTAENVKETTDFLEEYSREGLRTLLVAEKEITLNEYEKWSE